MLKEQLLSEIERIHTFFNNTIEIFSEEDSSFIPVEGVYTTAQQIAHTAQTVDWFMKGAFVNNQFDLDFKKHDAEVRNVTSLTAAKIMLNKSFGFAKALIQSKSEEDITSPLPAGPIMGGAPRMAVVGAVADHTAHHRGALAVYARLIGKVPKMPYGG